MTHIYMHTYIEADLFDVCAFVNFEKNMHINVYQSLKIDINYDIINCAFLKI